MTQQDIDDVALLIPCTFCGVTSGVWCVTRKGGSDALWLHEARRQPVYNIRRQGWEAGRVAGQSSAAAAMRRLLFRPIEEFKATAVDRAWLLATFYKIRKELIP